MVTENKTPIVVAFLKPDTWLVTQDGQVALRFTEPETPDPDKPTARTEAIRWGKILADKFSRTLVVQDRNGRRSWTRPARVKGI